MHIRIVHRSRGSFAFQLALDDGNMALTGAPQRDVEACVQAIRELITSLRERVGAVHGMRSGSHRFTISGERGVVLAESALRPDAAAAEHLLAELQRWAADETQFNVRFPPEQQVGAADIGVEVRYDLAEPSLSGRSGLELLRRTRDDLHSAHFNDAEGRPLLYLRGFTGAHLRDEQVRALQEAMPERRRYRRQDGDGRVAFVVTARNGRELARSRWFDTWFECEAAIAWLVQAAPDPDKDDVPRKRGASTYLLTRPATTATPGFETFRHDDRRHYFHVNGPDGAPLLFSHGYGSVRELDAGMRTLIRVGLLRDHYQPRVDSLPCHFVIHAGNGRELARSRDFTSVADLEAAILWLVQELISLGTLAGIRRRETVHFAVPRDLLAAHTDAPSPATPGPDPQPTEAQPDLDAQPTTEAQPDLDAQPTTEAQPDLDARPTTDTSDAPAPDAAHPSGSRLGTLPWRVEALLAELRHSPPAHPASGSGSYPIVDDDAPIAAPPIAADPAPTPLPAEAPAIAVDDDDDPTTHLKLPLDPPANLYPHEPTEILPAPIRPATQPPRDAREPSAPIPALPTREPSAPIVALPTREPSAPISTLREPSAPIATLREPSAPIATLREPSAPISTPPTREPSAPVTALPPTPTPPAPRDPPPATPVRPAPPKIHLPPPPSLHLAAPTGPREAPQPAPLRAPFVPSAPLYPRPATIPPTAARPAPIVATPVSEPMPSRTAPLTRAAVAPQRPVPVPSLVIHPTTDLRPADPPPSPDPPTHAIVEPTPEAPRPVSHTPASDVRALLVVDAPQPALDPRHHPIVDSLAPTERPPSTTHAAAAPRARRGEPSAPAPVVRQRSGPSLVPPITAKSNPLPRSHGQSRANLLPPTDLLPPVPPTLPPIVPPALPRVPPPVVARPRIPQRQLAWLGLAALVLTLLLVLLVTSPWSPSPASASHSDPPATSLSTVDTPEPPPPEPPTLAPGVALTCPDAAAADPSIGLLVAPFHPLPEHPVRLLAATLADEAPLVFQILDADHRPLQNLAVTIHTGVPSAAITTTTLRAGNYTLAVGRGVTGLRCEPLTISADASAPRAPAGDRSTWPIERAWTPAEEALHSAWLRALFTAPDDRELTLASLDRATRDPRRNLLHDALGLKEDGEHGLELRPRAADLPYTLRAYWAWKRRLPFAVRSCTAGPANGAAHCGPARSNLTRDPDAPAGQLARAQRFFQRTLPREVQPGNLRTTPDDATSDFYPVALARHVLRPGTTYADPYGHVLVLVDARAATPERPGRLLAIEAGPDGTLTHQHFWAGSFLHAPDAALGGSGFRRFRPTVLAGAEVVQLEDEAILASLDHGDLWADAATLRQGEFQDRIESLVNPGVRDPFLVQRDLVDALADLARDRVVAVEHGAARLREHGGPIAMPPGFEIFAGSGPWESLASPGRDLRLLTALAAIDHFVEHVRKNPVAYGTPEGERAEPILAQLISERERLLADHRHQFSYQRSDGSSHTLSLADLVHRVPALAVAYNPNDCPEHRWGAPGGSDEASTCSHRAPADQQQRMESYRGFFRERHPAD